MRMAKMIGVALIVLGALSLAFGGFTYTEETHNADLGPIEFQVEEENRVNIPLWAGLGAVLGGAVLLLAKRSGGGS